MTSTKPIAAADTATENRADHAEPNFEARWDAWKARGAAHDLELRRKIFALAPVVAIIAVTVYILILVW